MQVAEEVKVDVIFCKFLFPRSVRIAAYRAHKLLLIQIHSAPVIIPKGVYKPTHEEKLMMFFFSGEH